MHSCMTEMLCQISMMKVFYLEGCSRPSGCRAKGDVSRPCHPCWLGFHREKNPAASWHPPPEPGASIESPADRSKTCQRGTGRTTGMDGVETEQSGGCQTKRWRAGMPPQSHSHTHIALSPSSAAFHMRVRERGCVNVLRSYECCSGSSYPRLDYSCSGGND